KMSISFDLIYAGEPLPITLPLESTVSELKNLLKDFTGVEPDRQMFLNLPSGANETSVLASMDLKNIEMVEVQPNTNERNAITGNDSNHPITINDEDEIFFDEEIRRTVGSQQSYTQSQNTTSTTQDENGVTTTTTQTMEDNNGVITHTTTHRVGTGIPSIQTTVTNNYVRSPYATNFYPETDELSVQNLTDFLDPLSYPNFAEVMLQQYSVIVPGSFSGSFKDALNFAKKQGKLVLAYLHSETEPSLQFVLDILRSDEVSQFISENFIFWVAEITPEAESFLFSLVQFESYPILVTLMNLGASEILDVSQGCSEKVDFYNKLVNQVLTHHSDLERVRVEEEENEKARMIVQEQDEAYKESLRIDQEKQRKAKEEEQRVENKKQQKLNNANLVPPEPEKGPNSTQIIFKLPDDTKIERRFNSNDKLITLCHFLDGKGIEIDNYQFATMYPRKIYKDKDLELTLLESNLHPQSILNVRSADN
ncbi:hypothetical protein DICPUDRAFT_32019, partial [Dictyostelium purpureum]